MAISKSKARHYCAICGRYRYTDKMIIPDGLYSTWVCRDSKKCRVNPELNVLADIVEYVSSRKLKLKKINQGHIDANIKARMRKEKEDK